MAHTGGVLRHFLSLLGLAVMLAAGCGGPESRTAADVPDAQQRAIAEALLEELRSGTFDNGRELADRLAGIPHPGVIAPLVACLTGGDHDVRWVAAAVLDRYLDAPKDLERIDDQFSAMTGQERWLAGRIHGFPAPSPDQDWNRYVAEVRRQAAAVQQALTAAFRKSLSDGNDARRIALLFGALRQNTSFAWGDVRAPEIGRRALPQLLSALSDTDADVRAGAAVALGKIGDASAVGPIIPLLEDKDLAVRCRAAEALVNFGDPRILPALVGALKRVEIPETVLIFGCQSDPAWESASRAAWALGRMRDQRAVEPLIAALDKGDEFFQAHVAEGLGRIGDPRAVEPLMAVLRAGGLGDQSAMAAGTALARIGKPAIGPLIAELKNERTQTTASISLQEMGEPAVEPLLEAFKNGDANVRGVAGIALAHIKGPVVMRRLIEMLKNKDKELRMAAISCLESTEDPQIVMPLLEIAKNTQEDLDVRNEAIIALTFVPDARAIAPMKQILLSEKENVLVINAGGLLGRIPGPEPLGILIDCLKNNEDSVRRMGAVSGLGHVKDARAYALLMAALDDADSDIRWQAARSLGFRGELKALSSLKKVADGDPSENVREAAKEAIKRIEENNNH